MFRITGNSEMICQDRDMGRRGQSSRVQSGLLDTQTYDSNYLVFIEVTLGLLILPRVSTVCQTRLLFTGTTRVCFSDDLCLLYGRRIQVHFLPSCSLCFRNDPSILGTTTSTFLASPPSFPPASTTLPPAWPFFLAAKLLISNWSAARNPDLAPTNAWTDNRGRCTRADLTVQSKLKKQSQWVQPGCFLILPQFSWLFKQDKIINFL